MADANGTGFDYVGSLIYKRKGDELELESTGFGGGRIVVSEGSSGAVYTPNYFLADHLGSTRVIVSHTGEVLDRSDYYPFGLKWEHHCAQASDNRWLYNGKERQIAGLSNGVHFLDYGARIYSPRLGRWGSLDPLSEIFGEMSPNVYAFNNPVRLIDRFGLAPGEPQEPIQLPPAEVPGTRPLGPTDFEDFLEPIPVFSVLSAGITAKYQEMNKLAKNGQYLGSHNGQIRIYSLNYYGNQYVSPAKVAAQKAQFTKTLKVLRNLKGIFAIYGAVDLSKQVDNLIDKHTSGKEVDLKEVYNLTSSAVGLFGVPGALISILMNIQQMKMEAIEKTYGSYEEFRKIDRLIPDH